MDGERKPLISSRSFAASASRVRRPGWKTGSACCAILLTVACERIAFYGIVGNLVMFLNHFPLLWNSYDAVSALFVFTGISYMTSLLGGWIADSWLSRFRTILIFFILYIFGYIFMPFLHPYPDPSEPITQTPSWCAAPFNITHDSNITIAFNDTETLNGIEAYDWKQETVISSTSISRKCGWAVYLALCTMGIAIGAIKANVAPFGADQVKADGPVATRAFFNWFYWCINIGALIALGPIAYVQQEFSFFWGYIIPNIFLVIAFVIFAIGGTVYIRKSAGGSILTNIFRVLLESCRQKRRQGQRTSTIDSSSDYDSEEEAETPSCLDLAKVRYGGNFHDSMVDDVKSLGKIIVVFLAMVPYWIVYFQMETTYVLQGLHMRLDFMFNGTHEAADTTKFHIPAAWLSLFDVIFLLILIPLFDRLIYPRLDKAGYQLSLRLRIVIGMTFAVVSVIAAGVVEMHRLDVYWKNNTENIYWQKIGESYYRAADVTIFLQIPQYALIGISEVFASVAGLELAYMESPRSMQGLIMGLFWCSQGMASMLGTATVHMFQGTLFFDWDHGDINCRIACPTDLHKTCTCHLDYYFYFLAVLQLLGIALFVGIAWKLGVGRSSTRRPNQNSFGDSRRTDHSGAISSVEGRRSNPISPDHRGFVNTFGESRPSVSESLDYNDSRRSIVNSIEPRTVYSPSST